ncbi:hypothetical protein A2011_03710 [candidate division CPR3 bacterium GWE2_35_7]|uniref:Capsular polysaccharide assembling protein CapF C-terminal domain-containing protein n=1 Tax=candidate division CPR3 bacterium GW2011_GWF2_35_18 TaxID=1618350 RepID=A0A0G0BL86_UNCC3|nr:MAG: hypothetical protein UR67_C0001G0163 [candidate division CPR3 bacterium GW2011_GWF2_35_18]KKP86149.1 MAG: hypothetical protein UR87_C0028G0013 [candidate division CPR3 bacterium GW2011_GWE2_35_7]OGB64788.1 MAG: hypothetical protein A2250_05105 [candidate division CPR3 bacterium RIFOXYA2_FULL_35_13]OGB78585.1 MAG: hypothetical protein A2296_01525 [candidate division CPR3 bacterium RIFOXYB2_FULL_35_8]OGB80211.1 MAG: hypothetical protein A2011_03710 [candidate division CPR3 bacterium GWE2_
MIIKNKSDQKSFSSDVCGMLTEILNTSDFKNLSIVIANNIKPSKGHFHKVSTEIYWVYKGKISLDTYDEDSQIRSTVNLDQESLIVITPNIHHKVLFASNNNKLIVISNPRWTKEDEFISKRV